jgi:hypothetical protein
MTFKELANELMEQGWRCYHISDISHLTMGSSLHSWAIRNSLEVRVYEGKNLLFIKDTKPLVDVE